MGSKESAVNQPSGRSLCDPPGPGERGGGGIIREQIPDRDGHTIPPTVTSGSSEPWDLDHPGLGHVFEGKLVLDKTYGRAFYGCNICCRQYGAALHVTSFSGPVGGAPGNYVKIKGLDNYYTIYFHITPTVSQGQHVFQGNQIGITDNSGCQRRPHLHVQRKDPSGTPVNMPFISANVLSIETGGSQSQQAK